MSCKGKNSEATTRPIDENVAFEAVRLIKSGTSLESANLRPELAEAVRELAARLFGLKVQPPVKKAPEAKNTFLDTLKLRFESHPDWHPGLTWAEVERSIKPKQLICLKKMEEAGGEPDLLTVEGGDFVFADCSDDIPKGHRYLNYRESADQARAMGVTLMTEKEYRLLLDRKPVDLDRWIWLNTLAEMLESGSALHGMQVVTALDVSGYDADISSGSTGWRGVLRVKKAKTIRK